MPGKLIQHSRPTIGATDQAALKRVLRSAHLTPGREAGSFELEMAKCVRAKQAVAVGSGHAALHLALLALDIGPGSEVLVPTYACTALLNAIGYVGAKAVVADVDPETYNMTPETAKKRMTRRTRAVIAVHAFGMPCDIKAIRKLGRPVIEDAAMAVGGPVGTGGELSVFSFFATKMMATGQGGAITTNSGAKAKLIRDLIAHDNRKSYKLRFNYAMSDLAAALGRSQLARLGKFVMRRRAIAGKYMRALKGLPGIIARPGKTQVKAGHVFFRFCVRTKKTVRTLAPKFKRLGIEVKEPVFKPMHRYLNLPRGKYPGCESFTGRVLSLPIYPSLADGEVKRVINACRRILG
ncbi:MAG: DegT/DnrJ/EryC1/StrS aminotransferase family protein [Planctomycetota bacterium]|nr:MAG: DegT/DnrJ/EryC1/StrS aminotransferase family protein [Planctomycetota bacterium]